MSKSLKIFLVSLLISSCFWWGINFLAKPLENFSFNQLEGKVLEAQINSIFLENSKNTIISETEKKSLTPSILKIEAKSAISIKISKDDKGKILFEKNPEKILPIGSLVKLMTGLVVIEEYNNLSQLVTISGKAIAQIGDAGKLKMGEKRSVEELLYMMLIESSNDASYALAELVGEDNFIDVMNWYAKYLEMENTNFSDVTGLDDLGNYSTVKDLIKLTKYLLYLEDQKQTPIWEILRTPELKIYLADGTPYSLLNTNELLNEIPNIFGGKTGWTPYARGSLLLVLRESQNNSYLVNIILGSENRFEDMRKLIEWAHLF